MQNKHPIYIVSKGRWDSRLTSICLSRMKVNHFIVVEEQEYEQYRSTLEPYATLLILDKKYQEQYETCDELGLTKSVGPGAARNFAWDHSIAQGALMHWVMDDNIRHFYRFNRNLTVPVLDGAAFAAMEDFAERYENVGMAGPQYEMFVARRQVHPPFVLNTRIYSCNLIRNDVPYRWRGRYNEDTDLSLRMLKDGWCTVQFNAFLQKKVGTQTVRGGNTDEFYLKEGTLPKSKMLVRMHPDVATLTWKFSRWHHYVDYTPFRKNKLRRKKDVIVPDKVNDYGLKLMKLDGSLINGD